MEVRINGKLYKQIETLSLGKLEHLLQLAEIAVTNYCVISANYPPEHQTQRTEAIAQLNNQCMTIQSAIRSKIT